MKSGWKEFLQKHRDASVETNMKLFEEMCSGSEEGQRWCMRAKIDASARINACATLSFTVQIDSTPHRNQVQGLPYL